MYVRFYFQKNSFIQIFNYRGEKQIKPYPRNIVYVPVNSDNKSIDNIHLPGLFKRENLQITFKGGNSKVISFIMMNPGEADSNYMDKTVENLIKFIADNPDIPVFNEEPLSNIRTLHIANLFSVYNTNSENLQNDLDRIKRHPDPNFFNNFIKSNITSVKRTIQNSDFIVLAWGIPDGYFNHNLYFNQIIKVLKFIRKIDQKNVFVMKVNQGSLSKFGNPFHPIAKKIQGLHRCYINTQLEIVLQ